MQLCRRGSGTQRLSGYQFVYAGTGYGGSCFPKDVKALMATAQGVGIELGVLSAVAAANARQKHVLVDKVVRYFGEDLTGKQLAVWGLAFKPGTDDMREAPSRVLMEALWAAGASVRAYEPVAMKETAHLYPEKTKAGSLVLAKSPEDAARGPDGLALATEWPLSQPPNLQKLQKHRHQP